MYIINCLIIALASCLLSTSYAQHPALPDTIREIAPLPVVEIQATWGGPCCPPPITERVRYDSRLRRKYDTYNEFIFMWVSDVWMADPSARTGRD